MDNIDRRDLKLRTMPYVTPKLIPHSAIKAFLTQAYGLSNVQDSQPFHGGTENCAWPIYCDQGSFVCKLFVPSWEAKMAAHKETYLLEYLLHRNLQVSRVLPAHSGKQVASFRFARADYPVMVMYLENLRGLFPDSVSQNELQVVAQSVARLHQAAHTYPRQRFWNWKYHLRTWHYLPPRVIYQSLVSSPNGALFSDNELTEIAHLDDRLIQLRKPDFKFNFYSVLHGDLSLEHSPLLPDGNAYLFDFTDALFGPIAAELGTFFSMLFRDLESADIQRWTFLKDTVLEAYMQVQALTQTEVDAIPAIMLSRISNDIVYVNRHSVSANQIIASQAIKRWAKLLGYLLGPETNATLGQS